MPKQTNDGWKCTVCGTIYARDTEAISCENSHDIIYVQFNKSDLFKLIQFIYTGDQSLLTESLMKTLMKYSSNLGDIK